MENTNNIIDIDSKKNVGRPSLTQEEKVKREQLRNELFVIKKAIPSLVEAKLNKAQILVILLNGKEHLKRYQEKISTMIDECIDISEKNKKKANSKIKFKDVKTNKDGEITGFKSTVENFQAIIDYMGLEFKYNVVSNDIDIFKNGKLQEVKSKWKGQIYSIAQRHDCKIAPQDIGMYINTLAADNYYNPWENYVLGCYEKYKNEEEIYQYNTIKKLFSSMVIRNSYDVEFAFLLFKKFLLHFIASFSIDDYSCNGVFILQGPQNFGKTSFFSQIVPDGFFKEGLSVNPESDDSVRKILKYQLVELGEIESTLRADVNKLKNFITERTFTFRKQYADYIEDVKRHTVLCGTCNSDEFLKDETGDRRYWVIPISNINFELLNDIDLEKLWAEVYVLFQEEENKIELINGKRRFHCHQLTRAESTKLININKEDFTFKSTQQVKIESVFDWSSKDRYYASSSLLALKVFNETILPAKIGSTLKALNVEKVKKRLYGNPGSAWFYLIPPLLDRNLMEELNLINVEAEKNKDALIKKLGSEVEKWD